MEEKTSLVKCRPGRPSCVRTRKPFYHIKALVSYLRPASTRGVINDLSVCLGHPKQGVLKKRFPCCVQRRFLRSGDVQIWWTSEERRERHMFPGALFRGCQRQACRRWTQIGNQGLRVRVRFPAWAQCHFVRLFIGDNSGPLIRCLHNKVGSISGLSSGQLLMVKCPP